MLASAALSILALTLGCGGYEPPATRYHCETVLGVIGSNHSVDCGIVSANAALAWSLMRPLLDFDAARIRSITIRDEMIFLVDGARAMGALHNETDIEVDRTMFSLDHELGHCWLYWHTGDADSNHLRWQSSGQGGPPDCLDCAGRDLAYVLSRVDPSLTP